MDKDTSGGSAVTRDVESLPTPGPWTLQDFTGGTLGHIYIVAGTQVIATLLILDKARTQEQIASAKLISAAPDLLKACEASFADLAAMRECYCADLPRDYIVKYGTVCGPCLMRAAIQKARGEG